MANEKVIALTKDNFEQEVLKSDTPVVVDFWAPWCGPCRTVAPIIDELANDFENQAKVAKVNVDEQGELAMKYRVLSIPTIIFFKEGQVADKIVGVRSKADFSEMLRKIL
ncbi:MAG: thioredoxin [Clostridia bacterium]|nr:thioredoxin [Clostridia bacterium]